jgi:hypothetical protein
MRSKFRLLLASAALSLWVATPGYASFITWEVNEVFSNADGTIQFIEFFEANNQNGQRSFDGKQLKTFVTGANSNDPLSALTFTVDLPSDLTASKFALIATQGFATQPGAVQPDFVMPDGFIDLSMVVEIELAGVDEFGFILGAIPTDGTNSLHRTGAPLGLNSPTNFARQTGSIDLPEPSPAALGGAAVVCLATLRARGSRRIRRQGRSRVRSRKASSLA